MPCVTKIADASLACRQWGRNNRKMQSSHRRQHQCFIPDALTPFSSHPLPVSLCLEGSTEILVNSPRLLANIIATWVYWVMELSNSAPPHALFIRLLPASSLSLITVRCQYKTLILLQAPAHCRAAGDCADKTAWRKLQEDELCRQSVPVKIFFRYFVNLRQSKKIYWVLNRQVLWIFSKNKQSFNISKDTWVAASCHLPKMFKCLGSVFVEQNQKMREKYFTA